MTTVVPPATTDSVRFPDGSIIDLRPIGIRDGRLAANFVSQLSPESEYKRFLSSGGGVQGRWVASLITADQCDTLIYGAVAGNEFGLSLVAIAESIRDPGDGQRAEYALAATDPWQHLGIGTLLTRHVARIAGSQGIRFWETYMLAENAPMERVMNAVGTKISYDIDCGVATAVWELAET